MTNWIVILTFTYPPEAHIAQAYLASGGINSLLRDEFTIQSDNFLSNAIGGVKLMVQECDCKRSKNSFASRRFSF